MENAESIDSLSTTEDFCVVGLSPQIEIRCSASSEQVQSQMTSAMLSDQESNHEVDIGNGQSVQTMKESPVEPEAYNKENQLHKVPKPTSVLVNKEEQPFNEANSAMYVKEVLYLGSCSLPNAKDTELILARMQELKVSSSQSKPTTVTIAVPGNSFGEFRIFSPDEKVLLKSFLLMNIAVCVRHANAKDADNIFAFTYTNSSGFTPTDGNEGGGSPKMLNYSCHVFQCKSAIEASSVVRQLKGACSKNCGSPSSPLANTQLGLRIEVDIKEEDGRGQFHPVPREKGDLFKLRANVEKRIIFTVTQISGPITLTFQRCVGMFLGSGRYLQEGDVVLLETDCLNKYNDRRTMTVVGQWVPTTERDLVVLNTITEKDMSLFFTVGLHLHVPPIEAPITLKLHLKARIYPETERFFWLYNKKPIVEDCRLWIRETAPSDWSANNRNITAYEVVVADYSNILSNQDAISLDDSEAMSSSITGLSMDDESDEPLLSGTGFVSKEVTDEQLMKQWEDVLRQWQANLNHVPSAARLLAKRGIPEALRGEVWVLLAEVHHKERELLDAFKILISKNSQYDTTIMRDMNRTFPGNEHFNQHESDRQHQLFRVSKAYSLYDEEIGYVQGISFLVAALLLHMPEEQAFLVLVQIMQQYELRNVIRRDFEGLRLRLYQLDRLMMENLNDLWKHFNDLSINPMMYASQWFITLFSSKFPLHAVFHILDLFLCEGMNVIFKVALALLKLSRKDLLSLDFDGVLKYFRVSLPKRYQSEAACKELISTAVNMKIHSGRLQKYTRDWEEANRAQAQLEDPVQRLERELRTTRSACQRLERENDILASELVSSKTTMQNSIEQWQDKYDIVSGELYSTKVELLDVIDQRDRFQQELEKVKDILRNEMTSKEQSLHQKDGIIRDYKEITSNLSLRLESKDATLEELKRCMLSCQTCGVWLQKYLSEKTDASRGDNSADARQSPAAHEANLSEETVESEIDLLHSKVQELEMLLAATKLELTQCECTLQQKSHEVKQLHQQLHQITSEATRNSNKNWWNRFRDITSQIPQSMSSSSHLEQVASDSTSQTWADVLPIKRNPTVTTNND